MSNYPIRRALISVADKTGILDFCKQLALLNIEIISTGGTAKLLREQNVPVIDVATVTGFPEIMDGRVKTLHPKVHGALLARIDQDQAVLNEQQITPIDLIVVNLYPFRATINKPNCSFADAIENIDIGGPTMLRAGAKNHERVTVISDINDYEAIVQELGENQGKTSAATRLTLAQKAFAHTAEYDAEIAKHLNNTSSTDFPETYIVHYHKKQDLRYGENPHQRAAFYQETHITNNCIANAEMIQGKELSFNNIADADTALECVRNFIDTHACVIVKHANPCGVALSVNQTDAYLRAFATDPTSAFGGIIAFNRPLTADTARTLIDKQFVEVIIAPDVENTARTILAEKPNLRVLITGELTPNSNSLHYQRVGGGLLVQDRDIIAFNPDELKIVTTTHPSKSQLIDLQFAWQVAKYVKSNAIVYAKDQATIGIGAGQMSRIDSTKIAARKAEEANLEVKNSVMASDAFFPFRDAIEAASSAGIRAIIQPGGSIRDNEVIEAANAAGIAMVFTGIRHFRH